MVELMQIRTPRREIPREEMLEEIAQLLRKRAQTLPEAIAERELYFRVSVVGSCNLSCTFCHNEGAPTHGKLDARIIESAVRTAIKVGFTRIQFTGGEPLLHPKIDEFVAIARRYSNDVGITTNGTYLPKRLDGLVNAGLQRLHVSLQTEPLIEAGNGQGWGVPYWLQPTVDRAGAGEFSLRLNLPVPSDSLPAAEAFLVPLTASGISVKVFSILPEGAVSEDSYPLERLKAIVRRVNTLNEGLPGRGRVELRGFRPPTGIRCRACREFDRCKEQSHSLRLGADLVLRPCLATRDWDLQVGLPLDPVGLERSVTESAMLALDYRW